MENETQNFDPNFVDAAQRAAGVRANSLRKSFRLSNSEVEDVNQVILLGLLEQAAKYNPAISSANTFTGVVSKHIAADIAEKLTCDRKALEFLPPLTDAANDSQFSPSIDALLDDRVRSMGCDIDLFSDSDTLHDLRTAIAFMNVEQSDLFCLLEKHQDLPAACKASGVSTATFYRRVAELQMHLRMFGMRPAARRA